MQSLFLGFRRLYSSLPDAARVARTESTPRAVRLRRMRVKRTKHPKLPRGQSDATPLGATPTEHARYQRLQYTGELPQLDPADPASRPMSEKEWLDALNEKRSRTRGLIEVETKNGKELRSVGKEVWLPNVIFRLVRNHTPPGQPYNPYEATFRIPNSVTKTDIRNYLLSVYGVKTTYIRTDNYFSPIFRTASGGWSTKSYRTYKRAVVGLVDAFYYPRAIEDMNEQEREEREKWLEESFAIESLKTPRLLQMARMKRSSKDWGLWTRHCAPNRISILKHVAQMKSEREKTMAKAKKDYAQKRDIGQPILYAKAPIGPERSID